MAAHTRLPGAFAVKLLPTPRSADELARVQRRASALAQVQHPHVVPVLDFGVSASGQPFVVMELVLGRDLGRCFAAGKAFAPACVARILRQLAGALDASEASGVAGVSLAPEKLMLLTPAGTGEFVKVLPSGLGAPALAHAPPRAGRFDARDMAALTLSLLGHPSLGREPGDAMRAVLRRALAQRSRPGYLTAAAFAEAIERVLVTTPSRRQKTQKLAQPPRWSERARGARTLTRAAVGAVVLGVVVAVAALTAPRRVLKRVEAAGAGAASSAPALTVGTPVR